MLQHYLRFYRTVVLVNVTRAMQYRLDFLVGTFATVGWTVITIVFLAAIFGKVPNIAGWTYFELIALLGFYRLIEGLGEFIFYRSFKKFSEDIRRGRLDMLLTKPVDFQFYVSTRFISIEAISSALTGLAIFWYGLSHSSYVLTPISLAAFIGLCLSGFLIHYSLWVFVHAFNFWLVKVNNLRNLIHGLVGTTRFPPEAYGRRAEVFMSFVIPLALIAAFPVKTLLNRSEWWYLPFSLFISVLFLILSRKFFYFALKSYSSEGG